MLIPQKFEWADEYFGVSLSESDLSHVKEYIRKQEEYHRLVSWQEEYNEFMQKFGFIKGQG